MDSCVLCYCICVAVSMLADCSRAVSVVGYTVLGCGVRSCPNLNGVPFCLMTFGDCLTHLVYQGTQKWL